MMIPLADILKDGKCPPSFTASLYHDRQSNASDTAQLVFFHYATRTGRGECCGLQLILMGKKDHQEETSFRRIALPLRYA